MANASAERCDGKLECFLSRHLPTDDYQRLLTKQPCVAVVGGNEKPAHRFAIVGHCRLYLTDVPPKSVRMTLQLRDVESIQIVRRENRSAPPIFISTISIVRAHIIYACADLLLPSFSFTMHAHKFTYSIFMYIAK